jgi:hypothetical protein
MYDLMFVLEGEEGEEGESASIFMQFLTKQDGSL